MLRLSGDKRREREYSKVIPYDVAGGVNLKLYKKKTSSAEHSCASAPNNKELVFVLL